MRGYVATVVGGLAGFWVAYVTWDYLFIRLIDMCSGRAWSIWPCTFGLMAVVGVVAACGLAAAASVRLTREGAALETGLAVVPLVGSCLLSLLWLSVSPGETLVGLDVLRLSLLGGTPPDWVLFNGVLAFPLVLARWLGVAWHRRRMKVREA
jgi:hypothetical protein